MKPTLFRLNGKEGGHTVFPHGERILLGSGEDCEVTLEADETQSHADVSACLEHCQEGWTIEGIGDEQVLVNDKPVTSPAILGRDDIIRIGEGGPAFRFRLVNESGGTTKTFQQIISDSAVFSEEATRRPTERRATRPGRYTTFARQFVHEAIAHGNRRLRILGALFAVLFIALSAALVWTYARTDALSEESRKDREQHRADMQGLSVSNQKLRDELTIMESEKGRLHEALARLKVEVSKTREWRDGLEGKVGAVAKGLEGLSQTMGAAEDIYRNSADGVCLVMVGVAWYDKTAGVFIRRLPSKGNGKKGELTLGGKGEKVIQWVSGSGFLVSADGLIVTNRHVADPWMPESGFGKELIAQGLKPFRERCFVCFKSVKDALEVDRIAASAEADVAILKLKTSRSDLPVVPLAARKSSPRNGQKAILLGFPLGVEGLVAKLDESVRSSLKKQKVNSEGDAAIAITSAGAIEVAMTAGVLSNSTRDQLIYDAETTSGGSGGPIFGPDGRVIGVNTAISRFDGANFGVPVRFVHGLIERHGNDAPSQDKVEASLEFVNQTRIKASQKKN